MKEGSESMKKKLMFTLILIGLIFFISIPVEVFASETTDLFNEGVTAPNGNPVENYVWDNDSIMDNADVSTGIANMIMSFTVWLLSTILAFLEFAMNPTDVFLNPSHTSFINIMEFIFKIAMVFKSIIFAFLPFIMAVFIVVDFTKGEYRKILNRFVQICLATLALFTYNHLLNNAQDLRTLVNATQQGSYIILAATTGSMNDDNLSFNESIVEDFSRTFNTKFETLSHEIFKMTVAIPWEYGELRHTNLPLGKTYTLDKHGFGASDDEVIVEDLTDKVKETIEDKAPTNPYPETIDKNTLWRDVITYYPKDSKVRKKLVKILNGDSVYDKGFSGTNRLYSAFTVSVTATVSALFWVIGAFFLLLTYFMIMLGIPFGAFAFVALLIPTAQPMRILKGWLGFMIGSLLAKYGVVMVMGLLLGVIHMFTDMIAGTTGYSPDELDSFSMFYMYIYALIYAISLFILWKFRHALSPMKFMNFAMESMFNGLRGYKSRTRDPLVMLETAYRRKYRERDRNGKQSREEAKKSKSKKHDPESNGVNENSTLNTNPEQTNSVGGKTRYKGYGQEGVNGDQSYQTNAINPDLMDMEELGINGGIKPLENELSNSPLWVCGEYPTCDCKRSCKNISSPVNGKTDDSKLKLGNSKGDKLKITDTEDKKNKNSVKVGFKNKPLKALLSGMKSNLSLNKKSALSNGNYSVQSHNLPDGGKLIKLRAKNSKKASKVKPTGKMSKPKSLPNNQLVPKGRKPSLNKNGINIPKSKGTVSNRTQKPKKLSTNQLVPTGKKPLLNKQGIEKPKQLKKLHNPISSNKKNNNPVNKSALKKLPMNQLVPIGKKPLLNKQGIEKPKQLKKLNNPVNKSALKKLPMNQLVPISKEPNINKNLIGKPNPLKGNGQPKDNQVKTNNKKLSPNRAITADTINSKASIKTSKVDSEEISKNQNIKTNAIPNSSKDAELKKKTNVFKDLSVDKGKSRQTSSVERDTNPSQAINVEESLVQKQNSSVHDNVSETTQGNPEVLKGEENMIEQPKNIDFISSGKWGSGDKNIVEQRNHSNADREPTQVNETRESAEPINQEALQSTPSNHQKETKEESVQEDSYQPKQEQHEQLVQQEKLPKEDVTQDYQQEQYIEQPKEVEVVEQAPIEAQRQQKPQTVSNETMEIIINDINDDSYMYDDRLSSEQKMEIEIQQNEVRESIYSQSIQLVQSKGKASQNLLRKELKLDNDVAKEMISRMEKEKIIGKREGTKGHPILQNGKELSQEEDKASEKKAPSLKPTRKAPSLSTNSSETKVKAINLD
jgi:hypothetical protein